MRVASVFGVSIDFFVVVVGIVYGRIVGDLSLSWIK
jgi:hypothetical protein